MSSKHEDPASEIPDVLHDKKENKKYKRCRLFGKVKTKFISFFSSFISLFPLFLHQNCENPFVQMLCVPANEFGMVFFPFVSHTVSDEKKMFGPNKIDCAQKFIYVSFCLSNGIDYRMQKQTFSLIHFAEGMAIFDTNKKKLFFPHRFCCCKKSQMHQISRRKNSVEQIQKVKWLIVGIGRLACV